MGPSEAVWAETRMPPIWPAVARRASDTPSRDIIYYTSCIHTSRPRQTLKGTRRVVRADHLYRSVPDAGWTREKGYAGKL